MKTALVTGAGGKLGRILVSQLLDEGFRVRALVRDSGQPNAFPPQAEVFSGDIRRKGSLDANAFSGSNLVFHLAALVSTEASPEELKKTNVLGTRNVIEACPAKLEKFVHVSSISVYGKNPAESPVTESTKFAPTDPYGWSKFFSETALNDFAAFPWTVVRPGVIYGKGFSQGFFPVLKLLEKNRLPLIGSGENLIPLIHARDLCSAVILSAKKKKSAGQAYNIVGEQKTQKELFSACCRELGVRTPSRHVPMGVAKAFLRAANLWRTARGKSILEEDYLTILASDRRFDCGKARRELGWRPRVSLEQGIKEVVSWYKGEAK